MLSQDTLHLQKYKQLPGQSFTLSKPLREPKRNQFGQQWATYFSWCVCPQASSDQPVSVPVCHCQFFSRVQQDETSNETKTGLSVLTFIPHCCISEAVQGKCEQNRCKHSSTFHHFTRWDEMIRLYLFLLYIDPFPLWQCFHTFRAGVVPCTGNSIYWDCYCLMSI